MRPQELEAGDTLNGHPVDVDGIVSASSHLPQVHYELLVLAGVEEQVIVGAPGGQVLFLFSSLLLMRPITVASSANLMMELDPCTGLQLWVKRWRVEEWAQHSALRHTGAEF